MKTAMNGVPTLEPAFFSKTFDTVLGAINGEVDLDPAILNTSRTQLAAISQGKATEQQVKFAAVAFTACTNQKMFTAFVARGEALIELLKDAERQAVWASRGWVQLSAATVGVIAPARFLLTIAATCPLKLGANTFDVSEFERRAIAVSR